MFICSIRSRPTKLQVKTPVSSMLRTLCLCPLEENMTSFGLSLMALKKE